MSDLLDLGNLELTSTSLSQFIIGFTITVILSLILRLIYIKFSNSVSNKTIIANIFPLFGVSIFLIVITIKSSIVLSLGLVGALSIIRFRTAIKEAEQIVYFLILTGIAIATAAGSYLFPVIIIFFVYIYNYYRSLNTSEVILSINDQLVISVEKISNNNVDNLLKILTKNGVNAEVQSINKQENSVIIVLKLSDFNLDKLSIVEDFLVSKKIKKKEIQFFSSTE
ncbi:MAG: DUF4956 domain-containing protein [Bacteroidota bacterium]|nr:DUF4956 domain-containing protein [Bacteroidota bacterium]